MRIIRFEDETGQVRLGEEEEDGRARILAGDLLGDLEPTGESVTVGKLLAPLVPTNILCIGLNYREHAVESGAKIPEYPVLFMKPTSAWHPGR